ncbi:MAG: BMP family ABC transporter substrate-binding protein [Lachnospiraceae bacterium]|nr:BMP family ABC transporter substrate-binding protein [Lachnospiraceae bacterium]
MAQQAESSGADTATETSAEAVMETAAQTADMVSLVGVVTYTGGVEDEAFNQSAWEGLQRFSGETGCETVFYESASETDFAQHMDELVENGGDLCWGIGYSCAGDLLKKAKKYPDVSFAIIDYAYAETPDNMTGVVFRSQESSFLVGYIAANMTKTDKVGFVGGESNAVIEQFQYGYQAGVAYAEKQLGKTVEVEVWYTGSFDDPFQGKELASSLYEEGCDIVFQAAGASGIGVIEAAQETGNYVIGVDKDQSYLAPEHVLTSAIKNVNQAIYRVSKNAFAGESIGGKTLSLGLEEGAVGVSEEHALYGDEIYEQVLQLQDEMIAGRMIPPSNQTEYETFLDSLYQR